MPVLPDNTGPVIDSRGSCVPRSLDSIVLDHISFLEAGGYLKRAKLKWAYVFTYLSIHLTNKLKVTSKIQFQSVGPLNKHSLQFSSVASSIQCTTLLISESLASSLDCNNVYHAQWPH